MKPKTTFTLSIAALIFSLVALGAVLYIQSEVVNLITQALPEAIGPGSYVPGQILAKFKAGVPFDEQDNLLKERNLAIIKEIPRIKVKVVRVPQRAEEKILAALSRNPKIEFVELDYVAEPDIIPNDRNYRNQWHLPKISAPAGWDINTGVEDVVIAIIDTGVEPNHLDLASKLVGGYNTYDNNDNTADFYGHGTAVAGTVSALTNNREGVAGVSWQSKLMPFQACYPHNSKALCPWSALAEAVVMAADKGAKVINLSVGNEFISQTLQSAVNYAWNKGVLIVASAGNSNNNIPNYPAAFDKVVAVSATDQNDQKASFSNFGNWIEVSAPGVSILTTHIGGKYANWSGTSFSSPIVAGLGALAFSVNPALTNIEVRELIKNNADDLGALGFDNIYGWGRVNLERTLALAAGLTAPPADTASPQTSITWPADNSIVSGQITILVSASDNVGVERAELLKNGSVFAVDYTSPYEFFWDTTREGNGVYSFQARAFDAAGNSGVSSQISLTVNNESDNQAPVVTINQPADGAVLKSRGTLRILAEASDNAGVAQIDMFFNGVLQRSCFNSDSCSVNIDLKDIASGIHIIAARAYDKANNMGSDSVTVTKK